MVRAGQAAVAIEVPPQAYESSQQLPPSKEPIRLQTASQCQTRWRILFRSGIAGVEALVSDSQVGWPGHKRLLRNPDIRWQAVCPGAPHPAGDHPEIWMRRSGR